MEEWNTSVLEVQPRDAQDCALDFFVYLPGEIIAIIMSSATLVLSHRSQFLRERVLL